jgi:NAD(P)-dependent dehydrogenase (short-subunit alcohol dehydrogenase family)
MRVRGRRVLVTGATKGIGRAIVEAFLKAGASVAGCARRREDLPRKMVWVQADVTREADVRRVVRTVEKTWGSLDILVNNAGGIDLFEPFTKLTTDQWRRFFEWNLFSAVEVTRACLPIMSRPGAIVNIASHYGLEPPPKTGPYSAAKAAMINWTRSLSRELAPGVRVNAIAPGAVLTASWEEEARALETPERSWKSVLEEIVGRAEQRIPMGRLGRPQDVAELALYLAGASWVTGACLVIDGGELRSV